MSGQILSMERRVRCKSHARCEAGENLEMVSKDYLLLSYGITIVPKEEIINFVSPMSIDVFPGIGKALSKRLGGYKIKTLGEVLESAHMLFLGVGWVKT